MKQTKKMCPKTHHNTQSGQDNFLFTYRLDCVETNSYLHGHEESVNKKNIVFSEKI